MVLRLFAVCFVLVTGIVGPVAAQSVETLARAIMLDDVIDIMREEGKDYAKELEQELMPFGGGALWEQHVSRVYNTRAMRKTVVEALEATMTPDEIISATAFFETRAGREILRLETAARRAMRDEDVEDFAWQAFRALPAGSSRRVAIERFIATNDLLERNVAGALSSNIQFYRGMTAGGGIEMTEQQILSDVWSQEDELRDDTEKWLFGFAQLAYQPLSDTVLDNYIAFSASPPGQSLNAGLFAGFDAMYRTISYRLGLGASIAMNGSDL